MSSSLTDESLNPHLPNRSAVRQSFDRAAASYDAAALLQREVATRMLERLDLVRLQPDVVLDVGSGTGFVASNLRQRYKSARVIELDLALGMLQVSRRKASLWSRLLRQNNVHICGDMEQLPIRAASVDMVCSNLALQWLAQPDKAFGELRRILRPQGLLMFSTFGPDTLMEMRTAFSRVDGYPHVNRFIDMHDLGDALARLGFSAPVMDMEKIVLTYADVKAAMLDLKQIGAHNNADGRQRGMMGKDRWRKIVAAYEAFRSSDRIPATFEVIYGHAWAAPDKKATTEKVISFHPRRV